MNINNKSQGERAMKIKGLLTVARIFLLVGVMPFAYADEIDAKNLLLNSSEISLSANDPRIAIVHSQLETIRSYCSTTSKGAPIHDKLAYSYSRLRVNQSLPVFISDFVRIALAQCSKVDDSTLLGIYVLERNDGASHNTTVAKIIRNPAPLIAKWRSR